MSNVVDSDYLTAMRVDLAAVLADLGIPYHETEPRSLGETPAAWLGRPVLSYDQFEKQVVVDWPLTYAEHPVDPEASTRVGDVTIWELWRALGAGRIAMIDGQRSVQILRADPGQRSVGDVAFPVYDCTVRTTVHIGFW